MSRETPKGEPVRFFINGYAIRGDLFDGIIAYEDGTIPAREVRWILESQYEAEQDQKIVERYEEER